MYLISTFLLRAGIVFKVFASDILDAQRQKAHVYFTIRFIANTTALPDKATAADVRGNTVPAAW